MHLLVYWYVHLHVICSNLYNNTTPWQHSKLEDIFPVRGLPLLLSVNHQVVAEKNRGSLCLKIAQTFQNTYLRFPSHSQDSKRRRGWWRVGLHVITTFKKQIQLGPPSKTRIFRALIWAPANRWRDNFQWPFPGESDLKWQQVNASWLEDPSKTDYL